MGLGGFSEAVARRGLTTEWDALIYAEACDPSTAALVKAVMSAESAWDPTAENPADPSVGLMQILVGDRGPYPGYTREQLLVPSTNIVLGASFLRELVARYGATSDALSAYNAGHPCRAAGGGYSNQA